MKKISREATSWGKTSDLLHLSKLNPGSKLSCNEPLSHNDWKSCFVSEQNLYNFCESVKLCLEVVKIQEDTTQRKQISFILFHQFVLRKMRWANLVVSGLRPGEYFFQSELAGSITIFFSCLSTSSLMSNMISEPYVFLLPFFHFYFLLGYLRGLTEREESGGGRVGTLARKTLGPKI